MNNQPSKSPQNLYASIRHGITLATAALLAFSVVACKKSSASKDDDVKRGTEQAEATRRAIEDANARVEAENRRLEEARKQTEADAAHRKDEEEKKRQAEAERAEQDRANKERQARAAEEEATKQAQRESLKVAEEAFGRISLNPQITLTSAFKKANGTAELKGQDLEKFRALFDAKDWLGILKAFGKVPADAQNLPPAESIQAAADSFAKSKTFPILIKAPVVSGDRFLATVNELSYWLVSLPERNGGDRIFATLIRTKHPDGIGYVADWYPNLGNVVIVAASTEQMNAQTRKMDAMLAQMQEGLKTKIRLGEVSKEAAQKQLAEARAQSGTRFLEWADGATSTVYPTVTGIGATLVPKGKVVEVTAITAGGPAEKSGELKVGDRILAIGVGDPPNIWGRIDIPPTDRRRFNEVLMELRGQAGSPVYLKILPAGTDDPSKVREIKIIRAQFEVK